MTIEEARSEARRRWPWDGKEKNGSRIGDVREGILFAVGIGIYDYVSDTPRRVDFEIKGYGRTWEEAFADVDHRALQRKVRDCLKQSPVSL